MAAPLILASVTLDESGVVSAAAAAGDAITGLEDKTSSAGRATARTSGEIERFTKRVFSTERVARLLAHQLGLVGMVLGATKLVKDLISGSDMMQRFKLAMMEAWEAGVKMRNITEVLTERFAGLEKEAGVVGEATRAMELHRTTEALKKMKEEATPTTFQLFTTALFDLGNASGAVANRILEQRKNYDLMAPSLQKTIDKQTELASESQALVDAFKRLGVVTPVVMGIQLRDAAKDIILLREAVKSGAISADKGAAAYTRLFGVLSQGGATVNMLRKVGFTDLFQAAQIANISTQETFNRELIKTSQAMVTIDRAFMGNQIQGTLLNVAITNLTAKYQALGLSMKESLQMVIQNTTGLQQNAAQASLNVLKYEEVMGAVNAFGQMVQAAGEAGIASQKVMFRVQQAILSAEYVQKGRGQIAEAFAATGRGDFFAATMHKIASKLFFAAAGFHGLAAIRGQQSGGEGGGRRGRRSAELGQRERQRDISLTVIVDGNVIGNEAWVRGAVIDIQRQLSDGAGGGQF